MIKTKKGRKTLTCTQIETSKGITRDPIEITHTFEDYYQKLYMPLKDNNFDEQFKVDLINATIEIRNINPSLKNSPEFLPRLTTYDLQKHVKTIKMRKAASFDYIYNEHIKYGGYDLLVALTNLFNMIIAKGKLPQKCKMGLNIPVYKNNGKSRSDPKNYRPIALLPVIYKLFEKILHECLNTWIIDNKIPFPNSKLYFLARICNMPYTCLTKRIFNVRLSQFVWSKHNKQKGFIPDIVNILTKYNLTTFLIDYIYSGHFENKQSWKKICYSRVLEIYTENWINRISSDNDFSRFRFLHTKIEKAILWESATDFESLSNAFKISKIWVNTNKKIQKCKLCDFIGNEILKHCTTECSKLEEERLLFYYQIAQQFGASVIYELNSESSESKFQTMIGRRLKFTLDKNINKHFLRIAINFVLQCMQFAVEI